MFDIHEVVAVLLDFLAQKPVIPAEALYPFLSTLGNVVLIFLFLLTYSIKEITVPSFQICTLHSIIYSLPASNRIVFYELLQFLYTVLHPVKAEGKSRKSSTHRT